MISTSIRLLRIQLLKDFGINEVMHCRDSGKKRKLVFMLCIFIFCGGLLAFYVAGAAWVLCVSGAQDSVPGFVVAVSSMAIFIFTLFKAGPVLFAAGVFYYFTTEEVKALVTGIAKRFPGGRLVFDAAGQTAVRLMLKTWVKQAGIRDVGAYFSVRDAEKELPDAFLRRCVFHYITFPEPALMKQIVDAHFENLEENLLDQAMNTFYKIRQIRDLRKKPSTSEFIDWIRALMIGGVDPETISVKLPYLGVLIKKDEDLETVRLVSR